MVIGDVPQQNLYCSRVVHVISGVAFSSEVVDLVALGYFLGANDEWDTNDLNYTVNGNLECSAYKLKRELLTE